MKILDKIIISPTPPASKNVAWFDGNGIKIPNQGKWESTGGSGGSGIEIVESVDKLNPNAPVGSLASVAVPGKITEISVRDIQQPDASIIDQATGTIITANLNIVTSVSVDPSKVSFDGKDTMVYFCTENIKMMGGGSGILLAVMKQSQGDIQVQGGMYMNVATMEQKLYMFVQKNADGTTTVYQDQIDEFIKQFEQNTFYYLGFFEHMTMGEEITEEDYISLDNVKIVSGIPSKVHIYRKADRWEELYKKDFEKVQRSLDKISDDTNKKADIISIKDIPYSNILNPNTYYKDTVNKYSNVLYKLTPPSDENKYSEYIIEVKCDSTPPSIVFADENDNPMIIKWANNVAPTFDGGSTYIISIVNNFGVFSQFVND